MSNLESIWKFFASVKLTVTLLISLAATSIIGTLIPQNQAPADYIQAFGETVYRIFLVLDFFDMYHCWWFQLLLILLTANIVVCSIDRLQATAKIIFNKNPSFRIEQFRKVKQAIAFEADRSSKALLESYAPFVARRYGFRRVTKTDHGFQLFAERWRWTRLGVYVVHLSVILLLLGGLIGSIYGFDGFVNIPEGEKRDSIRLKGSQAILPLGFEVLNEDFDVQFYENGSPKEFRSRLTILENGKKTVTKEIIVNDPLRYKGVNFYIGNYGEVAPQKVDLSFTSRASKMVYQMTAKIGQQFDLAEGLGEFVIIGFNPNADFHGHSIGPAFIARHISKEGQTEEIQLPLKFPSFDKMRKGSFVVGVTGYESHYYSGLEVTRDPGVLVVYAGFIAMILGCIITFFMSHQRLCIEVTQKGTGSTVMVAATANKNKLAVPRRIEQIAAGLKRI